MQIEFTQQGQKTLLSGLDQIVKVLNDLSAPRQSIQIKTTPTNEIVQRLNVIQNKLGELSQPIEIKTTADTTTTNRNLEQLSQTSQKASNRLLQLEKTASSSRRSLSGISGNAKRSTEAFNSIADGSGHAQRGLQNLTQQYSSNAQAAPKAAQASTQFGHSLELLLQGVANVSREMNDSRSGFDKFQQSAKGSAVDLQGLVSVINSVSTSSSGLTGALPGIWQGMTKVERTSQQMNRMLQMVGRSAGNAQQMGFMIPLLVQLSKQFVNLPPEVDKTAKSISQFLLSASTKARGLDEMVHGLSDVQTEFNRLEAGSKNLRRVLSFKEGIAGFTRLPKIVTTLGQNVKEADKKFSDLEKTIAETTGQVVDLRSEIGNLSPQYRILITGYKIVDRLRASFKLLGIGIVGLSIVAPQAFPPIIKQLMSVGREAKKLPIIFRNLSKPFTTSLKNMRGSVDPVLDKIGVLRKEGEKPIEAPDASRPSFKDWAKAKVRGEETGPLFKRAKPEDTKKVGASLLDQTKGMEEAVKTTVSNMTILTDAAATAGTAITAAIGGTSVITKLLQGDIAGAAKSFIKMTAVIAGTHFAAKGLRAVLRRLAVPSSRFEAVNKFREYLARAGVSVEQFVGVLRTFWNNAKEAFNGIRQAARAAFDVIEKYVSKIPGGGALLKFFKSIGDVARLIAKALSGVFGGFFGDIVKGNPILSKFLGNITDLKNLKSIAIDVTADPGQVIKNLIGGKLPGGGKGGGAPPTTEAPGEEPKEPGKGFFGKVKDSVSDLGDFMSKKADTVKDKLKDLSTEQPSATTRKEAPTAPAAERKALAQEAEAISPEDIQAQIVATQKQIHSNEEASRSAFNAGESIDKFAGKLIELEDRLEVLQSKASPAAAKGPEKKWIDVGMQPGGKGGGADLEGMASATDKAEKEVEQLGDAMKGTEASAKKLGETTHEKSVFPDMEDAVRRAGDAVGDLDKKFQNIRGTADAITPPEVGGDDEWEENPAERPKLDPDEIKKRLELAKKKAREKKAAAEEQQVAEKAAGPKFALPSFDEIKEAAKKPFVLAEIAVQEFLNTVLKLKAPIVSEFKSKEGEKVLQASKTFSVGEEKYKTMTQATQSRYGEGEFDVFTVTAKIDEFKKVLKLFESGIDSITSEIADFSKIASTRSGQGTVKGLSFAGQALKQMEAQLPGGTEIAARPIDDTRQQKMGRALERRLGYQRRESLGGDVQFRKTVEEKERPAKPGVMGRIADIGASFKADIFTAMATSTQKAEKEVSELGDEFKTAGKKAEQLGNITHEKSVFPDMASAIRRAEKALLELTEQFQNSEVVAKTWDVATERVESFRTAINQVRNVVTQFIDEHDIKDRISTAWELASEKVESYQKALSPIGTLMKSAVEELAALERMAVGWELASEKAIEFSTIAKTRIGGAIEDLDVKDRLAAGFDYASEKLRDAFEGSQAEAVINTIFDIFDQRTQQAKNYISTLFAGFDTNFPLSATFDTLAKALNDAKQRASLLFTEIRFSDSLEPVFNRLQTRLQEIQTEASYIFDKVKFDFIDKARDRLKGAFSDVSIGKEGAPKTEDTTSFGVVGKAKQAFSEIKGAFSENLNEEARSMFSSMGDAINKVLPSVDGLINIFKRATSAVIELGDEAFRHSTFGPGGMSKAIEHTIDKVRVLTKEFKTATVEAAAVKLEQIGEELQPAYAAQAQYEEQYGSGTEPTPLEGAAAGMRSVFIEEQEEKAKQLISQIDNEIEQAKAGADAMAEGVEQRKEATQQAIKATEEAAKAEQEAAKKTAEVSDETAAKKIAVTASKKEGEIRKEERAMEEESFKVISGALSPEEAERLTKQHLDKIEQLQKEKDALIDQISEKVSTATKGVVEQKVPEKTDDVRKLESALQDLVERRKQLQQEINERQERFIEGYLDMAKSAKQEGKINTAKKHRAEADPYIEENRKAIKERKQIAAEIKNLRAQIRSAKKGEPVKLPEVKVETAPAAKERIETAETKEREVTVTVKAEPSAKEIVEEKIPQRAVKTEGVDLGDAEKVLEQASEEYNRILKESALSYNVKEGAGAYEDLLRRLSETIGSAQAELSKGELIRMKGAVVPVPEAGREAIERAGTLEKKKATLVTERDIATKQLEEGIAESPETVKKQIQQIDKELIALGQEMAGVISSLQKAYDSARDAATQVETGQLDIDVKSMSKGDLKKRLKSLQEEEEKLSNELLVGLAEMEDELSDARGKKVVVTKAGLVGKELEDIRAAQVAVQQEIARDRRKNILGPEEDLLQQLESVARKKSRLQTRKQTELFKGATGEEEIRTRHVEKLKGFEQDKVRTREHFAEARKGVRKKSSLKEIAADEEKAIQTIEKNKALYEANMEKSIKGEVAAMQGLHDSIIEQIDEKIQRLASQEEHLTRDLQTLRTKPAAYFKEKTETRLRETTSQIEDVTEVKRGLKETGKEKYEEFTGEKGSYEKDLAQLETELNAARQLRKELEAKLRGEEPAKARAEKAAAAEKAPEPAKKVAEQVERELKAIPEKVEEIPMEEIKAKIEQLKERKRIMDSMGRLTAQQGEAIGKYVDKSSEIEEQLEVLESKIQPGGYKPPEKKFVAAYTEKESETLQEAATAGGGVQVPFADASKSVEEYERKLEEAEKATQEMGTESQRAGKATSEAAADTEKHAESESKRARNLRAATAGFGAASAALQSGLIPGGNTAVAVMDNLRDTSTDLAGEQDKVAQSLKNASSWVTNLIQYGNIFEATLWTIIESTTGATNSTELFSFGLKKLWGNMKSGEGVTTNFLDFIKSTTGETSALKGSFSLLRTGVGSLKKAFSSGSMAGQELTKHFTNMAGGSGTMLGKIASIHPVAGAAAAGIRFLAANFYYLEAAFRAVMEAGGQFQVQMLRVFSLMKATGETAEQYKVMEDTIRQLGATTEFSATQVSDATAAMMQLGLSSKEVQNSLQAVLDTASVQQIPLEKAAESAVNVMNEFRMKSEDVTHILGVISAVGKRTGSDFAAISKSMAKVGTTAHTMGISLEQTTAFIGTLGDVAIDGGRAGTMLNNIFSRIGSGMAPTVKAFKELGIQIYDQQGNVRDIIDIFDDLHNKFGDLTQSQELYYAKQIFGQRALTGGIALITRTREEYEKLISETNKGAQENKEAATRFRSSWKGTVAAFQSALEGLEISAFEMIERAASDVVKVIISMIQWTDQFIKNWTPTFQKASAAIAELLTALWKLAKVGAVIFLTTNPIGLAILGIYLAIKALLPILHILLDGFTIGGKVIGIVASILLKFVGIVVDVAKAILKMIGVNTGALTFWELWNNNVAVTIEFLDSLQKAIDDFSLESMADIWYNLKDSIQGAATLIADIVWGLTDMFADMVEAIPLVGPKWAKSLRGANDQLRDYIDTLGEAAGAGAEALVETIGGDAYKTGRLKHQGQKVLDTKAGGGRSLEEEIDRMEAEEQKRLRLLKEQQASREALKQEGLSTVEIYKKWLEEDVGSEKWNELDAVLKQRSSEVGNRLTVFYQEQGKNILDAISKFESAGVRLPQDPTGIRKLAEEFQKSGGKVTAETLNKMGIELPGTLNLQQNFIDDFKGVAQKIKTATESGIKVSTEALSDLDIPEELKEHVLRYLKTTEIEDITLPSIASMGIKVPRAENIAEQLIQELETVEKLEYEAWIEAHPNVHLTVEQVKEIINKQEAIEEARQEKEQALLKEKETWELLLELESIDINSEQAVNILTELQTRENTEQFEEQMEKVRQAADEQRERVKQRAQDALKKRSSVDIAVEMEGLDPTSQEFATLAGELFGRGEGEYDKAVEGAKRAFEIDVQVKNLDQQKQLAESALNLGKAIDDVKKKEEEIGLIDLRSKLKFNEIQTDIQKYLVEPFDEFKQQIGDVIGKFQEMVKGFGMKRVDIKEQFGLYGKHEQQEELTDLQNKLEKAKTPEQQEKLEKKIAEKREEMGIDEKADKERMMILEKREEMLRKQLELAQTEEVKAGLSSQLSELLLQQAEITPGMGKRQEIGREAVEATKEAEEAALKAQGNELQKIEIQKESDQKQKGILEGMLGQAESAGARASILEQLVPILERTGDAEGLVKYSEELQKAMVTEAEEQIKREKESLEVQKQQLEIQKLTAEKLELMLQQNNQALETQKQQATSTNVMPESDPRLRYNQGTQNGVSVYGNI